MGARNLIPGETASLSSKPIASGKLYREEPSCGTRAMFLCALINFRAISTGQLHTLRCFHPRPINVVVYHGSSPLRD